MRVVKIVEQEVPGLGQRIKDARVADARTLRAICEQAGMTPMNWHRIEREQQSLPIETLRQIERVLGMDFEVRLEE